jgi:hypothetical protein
MSVGKPKIEELFNVFRLFLITTATLNSPEVHKIAIEQLKNRLTALGIADMFDWGE